MKPEGILFGEELYDIWKEVQAKLPRKDYCENLTDDKERTGWIIDEITGCVNITAEILEKDYQEVLNDLYEFLLSSRISLPDFTVKWIEGISEEEFDEDELSAFLDDTGMSEEEYLEYSAEGSYDISIVFEVLIYAFIIKNNPEFLISYLAKNDIYLNQKNLEKRAKLLMKIFNESVAEPKIEPVRKSL